jgi:hypothetical protein
VAAFAASFAFIFGLIFLGVGVICVGVALPLGLTVWVVARRDLARMRKGLMDPRGEEKTELARLAAREAVRLSLVCAVAALVWVLFLLRPWER